MKTNKTTFCKLIAISGLSLVLMNCSSNPYDPVTVRDKGAANYGAKLLIPTSNKRIDVVFEHQGTRGEGLDSHGGNYDYKTNTQTHQSDLIEVRPPITTQDSFDLSATSFAVKWNLLDKSAIGMNFYLALVYLNASVDIDVPAYLSYARTKAHLRQSNTTLSPKFELYIPITERVRIIGSVLSSHMTEDLAFNVFGVGLDYLATKNITLGLGYKAWEYESSKDATSVTPLAKDKFNFSSKSNVDISSNGISGELTYRF